jgi:hypothetical protein
MKKEAPLKCKGLKRTLMEKEASHLMNKKCTPKAKEFSQFFPVLEGIAPQTKRRPQIKSGLGGSPSSPTITPCVGLKNQTKPS